MNKITGLTFLLLFFSLIVSAQSKINNIQIDVTRNDKLNISQIAENVIAVPLNFIDIDEPFVNQLIVTNNELYVKVSGKIGSEPIGRIYQITRDGTLIRIVGQGNFKTDEFSSPKAMFYSEGKKELYIVYIDFIAIFDESGKLKRKIDSYGAKGIFHIFNNKLWNLKSQFDMDRKKVYYQWTSTDLTNFEADSIYNYERSFSDERIFAGSYFSDVNNLLYFTHDYHNEIISVDINNEIKNIYKFSFIHSKENLSEMVVNPTRSMIGNYINYGYRVRPGESYCFIYHKKDGESYNLRLRRNENGKLLRGINDDILNTGHFELRNINSSDYAFYIKQGYEVSKVIKGVKEELNPVLFLVKLK